MSSSVRGYSGFYKENYLRSSYEYVYCKILEKKHLKYKVEEVKYDLENVSYIPDFHVYDNNNQLIEIVEIKSNNKIEINKTIKKIEMLKSIINVPIKMYLLKDLQKECKDLNLQIDDLMKYWIDNSTGNPMDKEKNPMYGRSHSQKTKDLIGKKSIKRWKNEEYKNNTLRGLKKFQELGGVSYRPPKTVERITSNCVVCNDIFEKMITSSQKYCSQKCSLPIVTEKANNIVREQNKILHSNIRKEIIDFIFKNQKLFFSKKRNKLYYQLKLILNKFNLKDIRNVKFIFTGSYTCSFETLHSCMAQELSNYLKYMPNLHNDKV